MNTKIEKEVISLAVSLTDQVKLLRNILFLYYY